MNRDEQLKELFRKHWEKLEEERRAELVELGVIQEEKSEAYKEGYNKAVDDFFNELQKYEEADDWLRLKMSSVYEIAEQLKVGGTDE